MVAIAGMSPVSIAANSAAIVGYHQAGLLGGVIATAGIVFPSFVIVLVAAGLMKRMRGKGELLQSAFYGLRPAITGLIVYAAVAMAWNNGLIAPWSWHTISQLLISWVPYRSALLPSASRHRHPCLRCGRRGTI